MAKARIRKQIVDFLNFKISATTHEIYEYINQKSKHGVTMAGLSNLLSKDKLIQKQGTSQAHTVASSYQGTLWRLRKRSSEEAKRMSN